MKVRAPWEANAVSLVQRTAALPKANSAGHTPSPLPNKSSEFSGHAMRINRLTSSGSLPPLCSTAPVSPCITAADVYRQYLDDQRRAGPLARGAR